MTSNCPNCKKEIEHEDFLFELKCPNCAMRFNPFFDESANAGSASTAPPEQEPAQAPAYDESKKAFGEILEFGESLGGLSKKAESPTQQINQAKEEDQSSILTAPEVLVSELSDFPVLFDSAPLVGSVKAWGTPVSVSGRLDADQADRLRPLFLKLIDFAKQQGAQGIVSVQVKMSSDLTQALVFGIPVKL